jgi:hypothetical protein
MNALRVPPCQWISKICFDGCRNSPKSEPVWAFNRIPIWNRQLAGSCRCPITDRANDFRVSGYSPDEVAEKG